ncbi:MAG: glycosyltransferase family 2 protein [Dysgonamonadaceae bacterium]
MKQLTVIIPFLNEKDEIEKTLQSIRNTAGYNVDILLINDASYDGYDYRSVAIKYQAIYLENEKRQGVARSRDIGIEQLDTDYFLIVDGHMRFYNNNWWNIIVNNLKNEERALYYCRCKPLDSTLKIINRPSWGAYLELDGQETPHTILSPSWIRGDISPKEEILVTPCILGACYAASRSYWLYLKGLSGLQMYGSDEAYISIKVWLEGGYCILIKQIEIGHIFRDEFPYHINYPSLVFNKLLISETLLPTKFKVHVNNILRKDEGIQLKEATELLINYSKEVTLLRKYYKKMATRTFESFVEFNERVKRQSDILLQQAKREDSL